MSEFSLLYFQRILLFSTCGRWGEWGYPAWWGRQAWGVGWQEDCRSYNVLHLALWNLTRVRSVWLWTFLRWFKRWSLLRSVILHIVHGTKWCRLCIFFSSKVLNTDGHIPHSKFHVFSDRIQGLHSVASCWILAFQSQEALKTRKEIIIIGSLRNQLLTHNRLIN